MTTQARSLGTLFESTVRFNHVRHLSNTSAAISKTHRKIYVRMYPTFLVLPNGSSFTIRYEEPRKIIKLPLDLNTLSGEERKAMLESRKEKKKVVIVEDEITDDFNAKKYLKFARKN